LVEWFFNKIKRCRRVATQYDKLAANYLAFVGYGDIVALHPLARSLCNVESIIGQLYPATPLGIPSSNRPAYTPVLLSEHLHLQESQFRSFSKEVD
jgi:hypothetical protein